MRVFYFLFLFFVISCGDRPPDAKPPDVVIEDLASFFLSSPIGHEVRSIVIMLHSFQGTYDEVGDSFRNVAISLFDEDIASYRFNFDGEGERNNYYITSTMSSRIEEALKVYRFLVNEYPLAKIGVLGFSLGGLTATELITKDEVDVVSTVLWSSVYNASYRLISEDLEVNEKLRSLAENPYFEWASHKISRDFIYGLIGYNSFSNIHKYKGAMLTIRGTLDYLPQDDKRLLSFLETAKKEHIAIEGVSHVFNVFDNKSEMHTVIRNTVSWFVRTLGEL